MIHNKIYRSFVPVGEAQRIFTGVSPVYSVEDNKPQPPGLKLHGHQSGSIRQATVANHISAQNSVRQDYTHTMGGQFGQRQTAIPRSESLIQFKEIRGASPAPKGRPLNRKSIKDNADFDSSCSPKKSRLDILSQQFLIGSKGDRVTQKQLCKVEQLGLQQQSQVKTTELSYTPKTEKKSTQISKLAFFTVDQKSEVTTQRESKSINQLSKASDYFASSSLIRNLSQQVNVGQLKIASLEDQLLRSKNLHDSLTFEHQRITRTRQKDMEVLQADNSKQRTMIKSLEAQIAHQRKVATERESKLQDYQLQQEKLQHQVQQLEKMRVCYQKSLVGANLIEASYKDGLIEEIRRDLNAQATAKIELQSLNLQLQRSNQQLARDNQGLEQQITVLKQIFSTPHLAKTDEFSVFQDSLKLLMKDSQTYKATIFEKEAEVERLRDLHNATRIENQRLKNELKIEDIRRATDLKNSQIMLDIQKQPLLNQLRDSQHQLSLSQERVKSLLAQVKTKDQFILKNISSPK